MLDEFIKDEEIHKLRTEAGVEISSQEVISVIKSHQIM